MGTNDVNDFLERLDIPTIIDIDPDLAKKLTAHLVTRVDSPDETERRRVLLTLLATSGQLDDHKGVGEVIQALKFQNLLTQDHPYYSDPWDGHMDADGHETVIDRALKERVIRMAALLPEFALRDLTRSAIQEGEERRQRERQAKQSKWVNGNPHVAHC